MKKARSSKTLQYKFRLGNRAGMHERSYGRIVGEVTDILIRFPFVRTGRSVRPVCKWNGSVVITNRTGSG